jgi:hypothetical protein
MDNENGAQFPVDRKLSGCQSWYGHLTGEEIIVHGRDRILTHALFSPYPTQPIH